MQASEILLELFEPVPGFDSWWAGTGNLFIAADGSYTAHGVFAELTHFFREHEESLQEDVLRRIAAFTETCAMSKNDNVANAVSTCFLENLSGESSAERLAPLLGPVARSIIDSSQSA